MKKKIIALSSIAICILLIVIGGTSAYFTSQDSVINVINTGSINAVPEEDLTESKKVWVKNYGKNDCLVRVSITPRLVDLDGNPWAGDVNKITLKFNEDNLIIDPPSNLSDWKEEPWSKKWIQGDDEYYYYTSILPVTESTTELLSSVDIPKEYKDEDLEMDVKIDVKVEAVQTTQSAYTTVWDMNLAGENISNLLSSITPK